LICRGYIVSSKLTRWSWVVIVQYLQRGTHNLFGCTVLASVSREGEWIICFWIPNSNVTFSSGIFCTNRWVRWWKLASNCFPIFFILYFRPGCSSALNAVIHLHFPVNQVSFYREFGLDDEVLPHTSSTSHFVILFFSPYFS